VDIVDLVQLDDIFLHQIWGDRKCPAYYTSQEMQCSKSSVVPSPADGPIFLFVWILPWLLLVVVLFVQRDPIYFQRPPSTGVSQTSEHDEIRPVSHPFRAGGSRLDRVWEAIVQENSDRHKKAEWPGSSEQSESRGFTDYELKPEWFFPQRNTTTFHGKVIFITGKGLATFPWGLQDYPGRCHSGLTGSRFWSERGNDELLMIWVAFLHMCTCLFAWPGGTSGIGVSRRLDCFHILLVICRPLIRTLRRCSRSPPWSTSIPQLATALAFARSGAKAVIVCARRQEKWDRALRELITDAHDRKVLHYRSGQLFAASLGRTGILSRLTPLPRYCDVRIEKTIRDVLDYIYGTYGVLDVAVNNAGVVNGAYITDTEIPSAVNSDGSISYNLPGATVAGASCSEGSRAGSSPYCENAFFTIALGTFYGLKLEMRYMSEKNPEGRKGAIVNTASVNSLWGSELAR
jgi:NAD(P)-dependent dehydrogenase (short-subunit alcohol dehydrogenase family)